MKDFRPSSRGKCEDCKQPKLVREFNFKKICEECENIVVDRMIESERVRQEGLAYTANEGAKNPRK
jgi:hypothetical protein